VTYHEPASTADLAIAAANASGREPVVLVPGIWPLDRSWASWMTYFEEAGYAGLSPGWPREWSAALQVNGGAPAAADAEGVVAGYQQAVIERLVRTPAQFRPGYGNASFRKQSSNASATEIAEIADRGHTLTVDSGWHEVAQVCLKFIGRFV
jgi:hypothetical protein